LTSSGLANRRFRPLSHLSFDFTSPAHDLEIAPDFANRVGKFTGKFTGRGSQRQSEKRRHVNLRMKHFFSSLPRNIVDCFKGRMMAWHLVAIVLTLIAVTSGFDWRYFSATRDPMLRSWMFPSAPIGGLVPIALPITLLTIGGIFELEKTALAGWAVGQAELIGSLISSAYKAITGRSYPLRGGGADLTHIFQFGFMRGGVFWGWPSSHTTIAFAMAATILRLFPKQRWLGYMAITYALYIGVGVSMTIHWFSDFAAGAIIGTVIGSVVGKSFLQSPL
jgi:membrane-associated phospholipid phosphatase